MPTFRITSPNPDIVISLHPEITFHINNTGQNTNFNIRSQAFSMSDLGELIKVITRIRTAQKKKKKIYTKRQTAQEEARQQRFAAINGSQQNPVREPLATMLPDGDYPPPGGLPATPAVSQDSW